MGEILGLGMTHFPSMSRKGNLAYRVKHFMNDPLLPEVYHNPATWPEPMRLEWSDDDGLAASDRHRAACIEGVRWAREELDAFNPDLVLVWGDDQYENFREDIIPPFAALAYDSFEVQPWTHFKNNIWEEPDDKTFRWKGHRAAGKYLVSRLIEDGFDMSYAYVPHHDDLPHAFLNTALYLDWDRKGFDYPMLPIAVNCYGRSVISQQGGVLMNLKDLPQEDNYDPPAPPPWRCFDLGAAIARAFADSPWRVALIASSSWSHSFLTSKTHYFHPDVERDHEMYDALKSGNYELLNWFGLAGAMNELKRLPQESTFVESWLCNSDKVFAVWRP